MLIFSDNPVEYKRVFSLNSNLAFVVEIRPVIEGDIVTDFKNKTHGHLSF